MYMYRFNLAQLKNDVESADRILICDYSQYDPCNCHDGGSYAFFVDYYKQGRKFRREYDSSADFRMCPACGSFLGDWGSCHCHESYDYVSAETIEAEIINVMLHKDDAMVIKFYKDGNLLFTI